MKLCYGPLLYLASHMLKICIQTIDLIPYSTWFIEHGTGMRSYNPVAISLSAGPRPFLRVPRYTRLVYGSLKWYILKICIQTIDLIRYSTWFIEHGTGMWSYIPVGISISAAPRPFLRVPRFTTLV